MRSVQDPRRVYAVICAETLRSMVAAGIDAKTLAEYVIAQQDEERIRLLGKRHSAALRQRRWREKHRNASNALQSVTQEKAQQKQAPSNALCALRDDIYVKDTSLVTLNKNSKSYGATARAREADFEEFWRAYPRKIGKKAAKAAFLKTQVGLDILLPAIERYKAMKPDNIDFCHPTTWLNGERWNDELTPQIVHLTPRQASFQKREIIRERLRAYSESDDATEFNIFDQPQDRLTLVSPVDGHVPGDFGAAE